MSGIRGIWILVLLATLPACSRPAAPRPTAALALSRPDAVASSDAFPWLYERKIQGVDDLEPIEAAAGTAAYAHALPVARVEVRQDNFGYCTASRVGANLFLTNFHCDEDCSTMQFQLGFERGRPEADRQEFHCSRLVHKDEAFDYALYEAEAFVPAGGVDNQARYPVLTLWAGALVPNAPLEMPSYPNGRFKEIDRSAECALGAIEPFLTSGRNTVKHMCDTEGGSSGAPALDPATGRALALHWGGRDNEFNMAIPMALIVADLRATVDPTTLARLSIEE